MKRIVFWVDMTEDGRWGIECTDRELTFDGHFVAVGGEGEKSRKAMEEICQVLNMYLPPHRHPPFRKKPARG